MDDARGSGRWCRLGYKEAVEQRIIVPLNLLVYNVSAAYARQCAVCPELAVAVRDERISRENAELVVAMAASMRERNLSKAFSFHATIPQAQAFERDARLLLPLLSEAPLEVAAVWGSMGAKRLQAVLERARQAERSIIANPRVLGTGVDVPEVDLVVMASPRQSHVDVLQMAGRATRLAPGKPCGYVLCPARSTVVDGEEVLDEGAFTTALNVLRVFVSPDELPQQRLAGALREAGRTGRRLDATRIVGPTVEAVGVELLLEEQLGTALLRIGDAWEVVAAGWRRTWRCTATATCRRST